MLDGVVIDDTELNDKLREWENFYNFNRPHGGLGGQTPYERLRQKTTTPRKRPTAVAILSAGPVWTKEAFRSPSKLSMPLISNHPLGRLDHVNLSPANQAFAPKQASPAVVSASAAKQVLSQAVSASVAKQVLPQAVSAAILQRAVGDGDGRTGAAALNDGDAAALAAAQYAKSAGQNVDIKI